jgi:hypothetical protein
MNKNEVLALLNTINKDKYVGAVSIEVIQFAIDRQLIERTSYGNFQLTSKGSQLLTNQLRWEML